MLKSLKISILALVAGSALALGACHSTGASGHDMSTMSSDKAITCSKCQVTFVNYPVTGDKGHVVGYAKRPEMVCPDCRSAAENFFKTGEFKHTCKTCGDSMEMCTTH